MENTISIESVTTVTTEIQEAIRRLVPKIGNNYKPLSDDDIAEMVASPNTTILLARFDEKIVGMITLLIYRIPYVRKAYLDDLVIDEEYRGKGIAKQLMQKAMDLAKEKGASYIDLTANPARVAGNGLYEKFGFKKKDTNLYRFIFDYGKV